MAQQLAGKTYFSKTTKQGVGVPVLMALAGHGNMTTTQMLH
jgi:hypothetical protein